MRSVLLFSCGQSGCSWGHPQGSVNDVTRWVRHALRPCAMGAVSLYKSMDTVSLHAQVHESCASTWKSMGKSQRGTVHPGTRLVGALPKVNGCNVTVHANSHCVKWVPHWVTRGLFLDVSVNIVPNGGISDVTPKYNGALPNMKTL